MNMKSIVGAGLALFGFVTFASAGPITGTMNITGSITIDAVTINWNLPPPGDETGFGSFQTVSPGTGYFSGIPSPDPPVYTGLARDITQDPQLAGAAPAPAFAPAGVPIFIPGFLSDFDAPGYDGLFFDLTFIPLSGAALCTGAEAVGQSCRPDLSSPLTLKVLAQGTEITFGFAGFFEDPNQGADSRTPGTVQYTAATAWTMPQILSLIGGGGSITADYSAEANASSIAAVPEPATLLTLGLGLGFLARRRRI